MIFFFYGPNTYEARQQIARLVAQYRKKTGGDLGLERIDGSVATLAQLKAALQAVPFLSGSRLVIIEHLGSNKSVAAKIDDLLSDIPETTVAVFYDPEADQRTLYFKTLIEKARDVEFAALGQGKLQQWITRHAQELGGSIDRPAVGRLLELAGEDQWRLHNELAKLVNYAPEISVGAVNELVEPTHSETIFNLVEAVTTGQQAVALRLYRQLRSDGNSEVYILSMLIWQLRNLLLAKTAGKMAPPQLAKAAGMSPYVAGKMLARRHLFTEEQLKTAFVEAVECDFQIKSGEGDGDVLVEQLVLRLSEEVATRPS